ncbi:MAG: D-hexose-6-phosphate mutarotase [Catenulispora sp.]|nr:D-hexose-6-phosphate mutarotase [Catenulispora sp.]
MYEAVFDLGVQEHLTTSISRRLVDELPVIVVEHPVVSAAVTLQGAHLIAWQPAGEQPVLWLSSAATFKSGTAIRGGIPVCWPWFGPAGQPSHGFARISDFDLVQCEEDTDEVRLAFSLRADDRTRRLWPHDFELFLRHRLGRECHVTLEAHGDHTTTGALHSYLSVGDIGDVSVTGLGTRYIDNVTGTEGTHTGPLTFPDRTDRAYTSPDPVTRIEDRALDRTIEIHHHGNSDVVAWNPGPALSRTMPDLTAHSYRHFVCAETARITEPMAAAADAPATLATTISVVR